MQQDTPFRSDEQILEFLQTLPVDDQSCKPIVREPVVESSRLRTARKVGSTAGNVLFWAVIGLMLIGSVFFAVSNNPGKSIFGYRFYNIQTGSMTPGNYSRENGFNDGFYAGDMVIVKLCDPADVKKNDIITFMPGDSSDVFLTHRVVEIKNELAGQPGTYFVTRGDANNTEDPPISGAMLVGKKVLTIPNAGKIIQYIREHLMLCLIMVLAAFLLILALRLFFKKPEPTI